MKRRAGYDLRRATAADVPPLADLIHRTIGESYAGHYSPAAIAFYRKLGFEIGPEKKTVLGNGDVIRFWQAKLELEAGTRP
jgi:ribosomal protein S18 acetylase RimI-like enzyme